MKKIAIVGFGDMGKRLVKELQEVSYGLATVVATIEPDDVKYAAAVEWTGARPSRYPNLAAILEKEKIDGVIVSSPNHTHFEHLSALSGLAIPIWLEKPLDADFDKICRSLLFARDYRGPIMVDHVMRFAPICRKAKALIDSGEIGPVRSLNFVQNCPYGNSMFHNFRRTMKGGGGMFIEKATHDFDIMTFLTGKLPVRVAAISKQHAYGGDRSNTLTCSKCPDRGHCPESAGNILSRYGRRATLEVNESNELCVYAKCVDVPDNQTCMIEFEDQLFGTYSQCFFSPSAYPSREYEVIGLNGILKISFTHRDDGEIALCRRFGNPKDVERFKFDYLGRIHYDGGGDAARAFWDLVTGKTKTPYTTVGQAFVAEALGFAATKASNSNAFLAVADLLPDAVRGLWDARLLD